ncbi:unannotated protein [freshwater metagenome]|uniref:Unannotated protein n=1 Tax=freshwater metagenome TaxID=449393 RepID=A0A6J7S8X4_9ZZZZ
MRRPSRLAVRLKFLDFSAGTPTVFMRPARISATFPTGAFVSVGAFFGVSELISYQPLVSLVKRQFLGK